VSSGLLDGGHTVRVGDGIRILGVVVDNTEIDQGNLLGSEFDVEVVGIACFGRDELWCLCVSSCEVVPVNLDSLLQELVGALVVEEDVQTFSVSKSVDNDTSVDTSPFTWVWVCITVDVSSEDHIVDVLLVELDLGDGTVDSWVSEAVWVIWKLSWLSGVFVCCLAAVDESWAANHGDESGVTCVGLEAALEGDEEIAA